MRKLKSGEIKEIVQDHTVRKWHLRNHYVHLWPTQMALGHGGDRHAQVTECNAVGTVASWSVCSD